MRELIYLSQRKLEQFQIDRRGGVGLVKRIREMGIKAPLGMGEVKVGLGDEVANRYPQLARVLKELDRSDRAPRWYEEDGLKPGDWVQFEAPLNFFFLGREGWRREWMRVLMFLQPPPVHAGHGGVRLVLHGAPVHLLGASQSEPQSTWLSPSFGLRFFRAMEEFLADQVTTAPSPEDRKDWYLTQAVEELDREHRATTASWMAGYARVTMQPTTSRSPRSTNVVPRGEQHSARQQLLIASPLYVEYVSDPNRDS